MNANKKMITRTAVIVLVLVNQILVMFGFDPLPYDEGQLYEGITGILTVVGVFLAWYKNNSVTKEAKEADAHLRAMKRKKNRNKKGGKK